MNNAVLVISESGSGKSHSIQYLNPETTFVINIIGKDLPFRGWKNKYKPLTKDGTGNLLEGNDFETIIKTLRYVSQNRPEIKTIVIDDFQYIMSYEFMDKAFNKGFDKFTEMAKHVFDVIKTAKSLRSDLDVFILAHSETVVDMYGSKRIKIKTIGKLLDEKITIEGLFTYVVYCTIIKNTEKELRHVFLVRPDGESPIKTPFGMFETHFIDNNLQLLKDAIDEYNYSE